MTSDLALAELLHALSADQLALVGNNIAGIAAEDAAGMILLEDDFVAIHKNLKHIFHANVYCPAQLDGQNDTSKRVKLTHNTGGFHRGIPPRFEKITLFMIDYPAYFTDSFPFCQVIFDYIQINVCHCVPTVEKR